MLPCRAELLRLGLLRHWELLRRRVLRDWTGLLWGRVLLRRWILLRPERGVLRWRRLLQRAVLRIR